MQVPNRPNIFLDQGQFSDPDFINGTHQRENVQFADKKYIHFCFFPTWIHVFIIKSP
jgi:hypothetical protein